MAASKGAQWNQTWGAAMHKPLAGSEDNGVNWSMEGFKNQSLRQVVRVSEPGDKVRIRLSNLYGTKPLKIAGATIARSAGGAKAWPETVRKVTFGGAPSTAVRPGAELVGDSVALPTSPLEKLVITLRFAEATGPATFHRFTTQTAYRAAGDHLADIGSGAYEQSTDAVYYLAGVDVAGDRGKGTVVAFGDSLIDGVGATPGADSRLPDILAERLAATGDPAAVVNAGIGGNRLLNDSPCYGDKALSRFERDVLDRPGVRSVIVHLGANDIRHSPGDPCLPQAAAPTARQVIDGHRRLIRAAHDHGIKATGVTILPLKGALFPGWTADVEKLRDAVNHWIRTSGEYDTVLDADKAMADTPDPDRSRPAYVFEDGLHPNDAGYHAIARAIDLRAL
ncbi:SGNH/GDSL hydrolase family protein [Actinomadura sp. 9N407]|uniref:SGNH/GDSL hydrolase family protein n=1 Tax=Actinomadura sp. 9N407 TaxID=3375154 RepID=UPI00378A0847